MKDRFELALEAREDDDISEEELWKIAREEDVISQEEFESKFKPKTPVQDAVKAGLEGAVEAPKKAAAFIQDSTVKAVSPGKNKAKDAYNRPLAEKVRREFFEEPEPPSSLGGARGITNAPKAKPGERTALQDLGQKAAEVINTPARGMRGLYVGAATGDIERAEAATKTDYVPEDRKNEHIQNAVAKTTSRLAQIYGVPEPLAGVGAGLAGRAVTEKNAAVVGELVGSAPAFTAATAVIPPINFLGPSIAARTALGMTHGAYGNTALNVLDQMARKGEIDPQEALSALESGAKFGAALEAGLGTLGLSMGILQRFRRGYYDEAKVTGGKGVKTPGRHPGPEQIAADEAVFTQDLQKARQADPATVQLFQANPQILPDQVVEIQVRSGLPPEIAQQSVQQSAYVARFMASMEELGIQRQAEAETQAKIQKQVQDAVAKVEVDNLKKELKGEEVTPPEPPAPPQAAPGQAKETPPVIQAPENQPDAVFAGLQDDGEGGQVALFNITKPGHPSEGSTVSAQTLESQGLKVPEIPKETGAVAPESAVESSNLQEKTAISPESLEETQPVSTAKSEGPLASKDSRKLGDFEAPSEISTPAKEFKLFERVESLVKKYAKNLGEGYLPRGARGVFYPDTENIRVGGINDLSVATHEIAHFLDISKLKITDQLKKAPLSIRQQMTAFYVENYPTAKPDHPLRKRMVEGFAALIQRYVESPSTVTQKYPGLVKEFLTPGGKHYHPVMGEIIKDIRGIVADYHSLDALDKVGAYVTSDKPMVEKESFMNIHDKIKTEVADNIFPIEVLSKKAGTHFTSKDPSLWLRSFKGSSGVAIQNIVGSRGYWALRSGEFKKVMDFNWKNLIGELEESGQSESFGYYLVARRLHYEWSEVTDLEKYAAELVESLKTDPALKPIVEQELPVVTAQINAIKEKLNRDPVTKKEADEAWQLNSSRFSAQEKMFDALVAEDLKTLHEPEVGLVDDDLFDSLRANQGYASLKREFFDEIVGEEVRPMTFKVGKSKVSSMMARKGSSRTIINPVYSGIRNHFEITKKSMQQAVRNQITKNLAPEFPQLFQKTQLKAMPDKDGRILFPQEKDSNIIMARENYKRVPYLVDAAIKATVDDILTPQSSGWFEKIFQGASTFFTKGTTGAYPTFSLSNFVIDQISAAAQTRNKYIPVYSSLKNLMEVVQGQPDSPAKRFFEEYLVLGGDKQTLVGWQDLSPEELFKKIAGERMGILKVIDAVNSGVDILALPSKWSEIATRAAEYAKARAAGKTQFAAMEQAGRVTAPFHHVGRLGGSNMARAYIRSIPFFNASLQVLAQSAETLGTQEGRQRYAFVLAAVTASMIAAYGWMAADGTDEQKENYLDLEANELARYVYFPSSNGKDLIKIRVPENFGMFAAMFNMFMAESAGNADYKASDYAQAATSFLPAQIDPSEPGRALLSWIPQLLKPAAMVTFGMKDYPRVIPMEGAALRRLPSEMRQNEGTSKLAKFLGSTEAAKTFDLSPIKLDFLITGYFGRASGFLTLKPQVFQPWKSFVREHYLLNGRRMERFYELKEKNEQDMAAIKVERNRFSPEETKRIRFLHGRLKPLQDHISDLRKMDIEKDKERAFRLRAKILEHMDELEK